MIKRQIGQGWRRLFFTRWALALLALLGLWLLYAAGRGFWKERLVRGERLRVESQLAALSAREKKLEAEVARLESPEGLEAKIREKFSVVKEGEKLIVLVPGEAATSSGTSTASWWQKYFSRD